MHRAYDTSPKVQSSVVKLQALMRGVRTRAASSRDLTSDLDWACKSVALEHDDTGDFDENEAESPRQYDMASPRASDLEKLRYDMLDLVDAPEDAQSGTVILEMVHAKRDHKHVESWARQAEDHLDLLTKRLLALLEAKDARGSCSENAALVLVSAWALGEDISRLEMAGYTISLGSFALYNYFRINNL